MFDPSANGRTRHRERKPVMYDLTGDAEWGRPLGRWTKRKPTKRAFVLLACLFVAAVYGVRVWNAAQHAPERRHPPTPPPVRGRPPKGAKGEEKQQQQQRQQQEGQQQHEGGLNWDLLEKPPLFGEYHVAEMAFPQHHVADPFANGRKYLWVENHVHGACPVFFVFASRV